MIVDSDELTFFCVVIRIQRNTEFVCQQISHTQLVIIKFTKKCTLTFSPVFPGPWHLVSKKRVGK